MLAAGKALIVVTGTDGLVDGVLRMVETVPEG
jgi:hypothetical protein